MPTRYNLYARRVARGKADVGPRNLEFKHIIDSTRSENGLTSKIPAFIISNLALRGENIILGSTISSYLVEVERNNILASEAENRVAVVRYVIGL